MLGDTLELPSAGKEAVLGTAELERSMRLSIASGSLGMVYIAVAIGMPLPLFMQAIHASGAQLGLLSAAWQFAMLAQLPSTLLVQRLGKRKPLWAAVSLSHRLLWAVPALLPMLMPSRSDLWPVCVIVALGLSNVLGQAGSGPWQGWMADLIPPLRAGRFWGLRQAVLSISLVLSALGFGIVLDRFSSPAHKYLGFQIVFACAAFFGCSDIILHCGVFEPAMHPNPPREAFWRTLARPLSDRGFVILTILMGLWAGSAAMVGYTMGLPGFFAMVYAKDALGATFTQASWIFMCSGLGAVLLTPRIGNWLDRLDARSVLSRLVAVGPVCMLGWLLVPGHQILLSAPWAGSVSAGVVVMCVLSLPIGGVYAGVYVCQFRLAQAHTAPQSRTVAMGLHWALSGLIASAGPLAAGWLKDHLAGRSLGAWYPGGARISYFQLLVVLHAGVAWLVVLPLSRRIR